MRFLDVFVKDLKQEMSSLGGHLCVFCTLPRERMVDENVTAIAIRDGYPVSLGHPAQLTDFLRRVPYQFQKETYDTRAIAQGDD